MFYYKSYGLTLQSEVFLPEFIPTPPPQQPDIVIQFGDDQERLFPAGGGLTKERCKGGVIVHWQDIASYKITAGKTVTIYPNKKAHEVMVRQPLYGVVIATLLMQRENNLVLHGSVVELQGQAIIMVGRQGAGKSTLSACLMLRGCRLIADDVAVIQFDPSSGEVKVPTGVPHVRLWPSTVRFLGLDLQGMPCVNHKTEKRVYDVRERFDNKTFSLGGVITFGSGSSIEIIQLSTIEKMKSLISAQYFAKSHAVLSRKEHESIFKNNAYLSKTGRFVRLNRPFGLNYLSAAADSIERLFL